MLLSVCKIEDYLPHVLINSTACVKRDKNNEILRYPRYPSTWKKNVFPQGVLSNDGYWL